jgi:hypothetical protein
MIRLRSFCARSSLPDKSGTTRFDSRKSRSVLPGRDAENIANKDGTSFAHSPASSTDSMDGTCRHRYSVCIRAGLHSDPWHSCRIKFRRFERRRTMGTRVVDCEIQYLVAFGRSPSDSVSPVTCRTRLGFPFRISDKRSQRVGLEG